MQIETRTVHNSFTDCNIDHKTKGVHSRLQPEVKLFNYYLNSLYRLSWPFFLPSIVSLLLLVALSRLLLPLSGEPSLLTFTKALFVFFKGASCSSKRC